MSHRRLEYILWLVALLLVGSSAFQLFIAPQMQVRRDDDWQARLSDYHHTVKRRQADGLVWQDALRGDVLERDALLFTYEDSSADLSLMSGTKLSISENTLLRIGSEDNPALNVEKGAIHASLGKEAEKLNIVVQGKTWELSGKNAQFTVGNSEGKTQLTVLQGEVKLAAEEKEVSLKERQRVDISSDTAITVSTVRFQLKKPDIKQVQWVYEELTAIDFEWQADEGVRDVVWQISYQHDFRKIFREQASSEGVSAELPSGLYYWRLQGKDEQNLLVASEVRTLRLNRELPPLLIYPAQGETFQIARASKSENITEKQLTFSWDASGESNFIIEIDDEDDSNGIGQSHKVQGVNHPVSLSVPQIWRWRVKINEVNRPRAVWSQWNKFDLQLLPWQSGVDVSLAPEVGQKIVLDRPDQKVTFTWQASKGPYTLQLAKDGQFQNVTQELSVQEERAEVIFSEVGTWYWRTWEINEKGEKEYARAIKVEVEAAPPVEVPEALPDTKTQMEVIPLDTALPSWWKRLWHLILPVAHAETWETRAQVTFPAHGKAKNYRIQIFRQEDMEEKLLDMEIDTPQITWRNVKPGKYWWRYSIVDHWGRSSKFSELSILEVELPPNLPVPERSLLVSPIRAQEVDHEQADITLYWKKAARVEQYLVKVASDEKLSQIVSEGITQETKWNVKSSNELEYGHLYYWQVTSKNQWGATVSSVGRFKTKEKTIEPEVIVPIAEVAKKEVWLQQPFSSLQLSYTPTQVSITLDDQQYNGKIDGNALMGLALTGRWIQKQRWDFQLEIRQLQGKVFKGENFQERWLAASAMRLSQTSSRSWLSWGAVIAQRQTSAYELLTPSELGYRAVNAFAVGAKLQWEWHVNENWSTLPMAQFMAGDAQEISLRLPVRRRWRKSLYWEVGAGMRKADIKDENGQLKQSMMSLELAAGMRF